MAHVSLGVSDQEKIWTIEKIVVQYIDLWKLSMIELFLKIR